MLNEVKNRRQNQANKSNCDRQSLTVLHFFHSNPALKFTPTNETKHIVPMQNKVTQSIRWKEPVNTASYLINENS